MLRNIGTVDQVVRAIVGLALVALTAQDGISVPTVVLSATVGVYLLATVIFPVLSALCGAGSVDLWSS